ncbi:extracellular matrix protein 2-like [Moschus berezovskii]|uniref:extracellular matrix protein 2-like n=1 Tax=Moschus berezovskii TaxID=68408 RepID=UPI002444B71F|nr:extracellular matrix protein 2-like [Moschus berezovskii]
MARRLNTGQKEEVEAWRKGSCPEVGGTGAPSQLCQRVLSPLELGGLSIGNCDRGAGATMVQHFISFASPGGHEEGAASRPGSLGGVLPWRGLGQASPGPERARGPANSHRAAHPAAAITQRIWAPRRGEKTPPRQERPLQLDLEEWTQVFWLESTVGCPNAYRGDREKHGRLEAEASPRPRSQVQPMLRNGSPDRPEDRQLDRPRQRPTSKEGTPGAPTRPTAPRWKVLARPGLTQRKSTQPAAWEYKQGHNHAAGTVQFHPQATDTTRPGVARTPQVQEGAMAAKKGQGGPQQPRPAGWREKKDHSRDEGVSNTSETTGRGRKRTGSRRGQSPGPIGPGTAEQVMPSLPASCLLVQAAIACGNVKMKRVPALSDPGLTTLYLAENEIAKIPARTFLGLPNLEWLDLSKNKLDALGLHPHAFKNLTRLKRLNLDGNLLSTVPALPASLQELKLNDNLLQGLEHSSFRGLSQLLTLEVEGNRLHDGNISPLAFQPLRSLLYLRLDRNQLQAIPPGLPASLQELHLGTNVIEEVREGTLNHSRSLSVLVLSNNRLQEDRLAPRAWIDLPKLEALDLSYNRLVHVPSFLPRGLRHLTLHHNRIECIPGYVFAHMKPGLETLHLAHNSLREDGINGMSFLGLQASLAELLLDHNQLQAIPRGLLGLRALQVLRLSHNKIRHVPLNSICDTRVAQDSNLISTHLENNLIDRRRIPPTAFSCIRAYHSVVLEPQQGEGESA